MAPAPTYPEWWNWELSFTAHAEKLLVVVTPYEVSQ
jgi:hypothetical protein